MITLSKCLPNEPGTKISLSLETKSPITSRKRKCCGESKQEIYLEETTYSLTYEGMIMKVEPFKDR